MKWLRASLYAQAVLALYFQLIQWLPLGRWNHQPGFTPFLDEVMAGRATVGDCALLLAFAAPFLIFWLAYSKGLRWLMWIGLAGYAVWLTLQIKTWWVAYLFGASDRWMEVYQRVFSQSTQVLPRFGRHLPPDGMHLVLQLLLVAIVACGVIGLVKTHAHPSR